MQHHVVKSAQVTFDTRDDCRADARWCHVGVATHREARVGAARAPDLVDVIKNQSQREASVMNASIVGFGRFTAAACAIVTPAADGWVCVRTAQIKTRYAAPTS